jgi:hypothetical protein
MKPTYSEYSYLKTAENYHSFLWQVFFDVLLLLHVGKMSIKDGFMIIFSGSSVAFCSISGPINRGWNCKELLRNKRRFTWGWAEVLSMDHTVQIQHWTVWGGALFWPIAFSHLCCDTQKRMILHKGARPKVSLGLNSVTQNDKKNSASGLQFENPSAYLRIYGENL